ncbi:TatD family hydrolase [Marinicella sp. W31]|uniref:TatD family hydrolase n=1 Tax=Marinicella sp. W31 TaxID=3023713 RepID=UPI0037575E1B
MIDSHIHLDDARFDDDRAELLTVAAKRGVEQFIVPAVQASGFQKLYDLSLQYASIKPAYGLHPYWIATHQDADLEFLDQWLQQYTAVALGECGLDYYLKHLDKEKQRVFFEQQIVLAKEHQLPLILHVRGAVQDVFDLLKKHNYFKAVMHSFNGSVEQAQQITAAGVYLGFGGAITYSRATKLRTVVENVPLQYLMVETDAPDQPVNTAVDALNRPENLLDVVEAMATIKNVEVAELAAMTRVNCQQLFGL